MLNKLGIFGGSFEPFHNEHKNIAKAAVKELELDKLYVMPAFTAPHKQNENRLTAKVRLDLINLSLDDGLEKESKIEVCDYELEKGGTSYTYQTAEHFYNSASELWFIVGADMLTDFKTWKNPEIIMEKANLAVFLREGFSFDEKAEQAYFLKRFGKGFKLLNYVGKNVSATKIRVYSMLNLDITPFVTAKQAEYITKNNVFYREDYAKYISYVIDKEKPQRVLHTANVIVCALKKAHELNLDKNDVFIAALLHDNAKYQSKADYPCYRSPLNVQPAVEHAFLGAYIAEQVLKIDNEEIIDAIRYHTSGKAEMSALGKLIFTADMVEEGRSYNGVKELQKLYEQDFEKCFNACVKEEMKHLLGVLKRDEIFNDTILCYEYYCK